MASTMMDLNLAAQENILNAMDTSKAYVLESVKVWSQTSKRLLPEMPAIPGMAQLVDPAGAVSMSYDFAEKLLASQRSFVEELVSTMSPAPAE